MSEINVWSKVAVKVQSALAAAKTITAISKASTAVASITANGYADGDILLLEIVGMTQLNYRLVRVDNAATDAVDLEGIDSTLFDDFVSGTAKKVTFGNTASTFTDWNASGGEAGDITVQTIHTDQAYNLPGNRTPMVMTSNSLWDTSDPALVALNGYDSTGAVCGVLLQFRTGRKVYFAANPSCNLSPTGQAGQTVNTQVKLNVRGLLTYYAS